MSDRMNDVLAAIDAETAKCICGRSIPANGPSIDYCSLPCQYRYAARLVGTTPDYENLYDADDETTDGRAINEEVARELARPAPVGAAEFHSGDAMRQRLGQEREQSHGVDAVRYSMAAHLRAVTVPIRIDRVREGLAQARDAATAASSTTGDLGRLVAQATGIPEDLARPSSWLERVRAWEALSQGRIYDQFRSDRDGAELRAIVPDDDTRAAYLALAEGRTRLAVSLAQTGATPEHFQRVRDEGVPTVRLPEFASVPPERARGILYVLDQFAGHGILPSVSMINSLMRPQPEPALTGEAFRARALEARQNRGTGPAERRQRLPRDHGHRRNR